MSSGNDGDAAAAAGGGAAGADAAAAAAKAAKAEARAKWKALESNPDVFTAFAHRVGLPETLRLHDVFSLDDEMLAFVPQPAYAVILLFPSTMKGLANPLLDAARARALPDNVPQPFVMEQISELGNACGTVALLHVMANKAAELNLDGDGLAVQWVKRVADMTPTQRGQALNSDDALRGAHNGGATSSAAQTAATSGKVDYHFVAFIEHHGLLIELDGANTPRVLNFGPVGERSLLKAAGAAITDGYIKPSGQHDFVMMSLGPAAAP